MKRHQLFVRMTSFCLILALMLVGMPVVALDNAETAPAIAPLTDETMPAVTETTVPAVEESLLGEGELTYAELQTAVLAPADVPDALPAGTVEAKEHVNRLYAQEEGLSHLLFQNRDGGKTAYFYDKPVKYVAEDGSVRDKSKTLIAVNKIYDVHGYDYGVEDNNIRQYYAANPAVGVLIEVGGGTIRVIPQAAGGMLLLPYGMRTGENTFIYDRVFGNTTALVYTPLLSGVKEDIILRSYAGVSDFTFTYRTSGLSLVELEGTYTFVDEDGLPQITLGEVLITDAEGKSAIGSLTVTETSAGNYTVIIHADRDFLTAPDTVYPVTVDPDFIGETYNTASTIYQMFRSYNVCTSTSYWDMNYSLDMFLLGKWSESCTGRVVYRMPMFIPGGSPKKYDDMSPYQVFSATINIYMEAHTSNRIITRPIATPHTLTNHSTDMALFDGCGYDETNDIDIPYNITTVPAGDWICAIDMTNTVKSWLAYNRGDMDSEFGAYNPSHGMALLQENEAFYDANGAPLYIRINEIQYGTYVVLDYGDYGGEYYINGLNTGKFLNVTSNGADATVAPFDPQTTAKWTIAYRGSGNYTIKRSGSNDYLFIDPSISEPSTTYYPGSSMGIEVLWGINSELLHVSLWNVSYERYLLDCGNYPSTIAEVPFEQYERILWQLLPVDEYVNLEDFSLPDAFYEPGQYVNLATLETPANATLDKPEDYIWTSDNENFEVSFGGKIYIHEPGGIATITATHKHTGKTDSCTVKSGIVKEAIYKLESKANGRFMDINGPSYNVNEKITQYNLHGGAQQEWIFTLLTDGTYLIESCLSHHYASLASSGSGIVQKANTNATKWIVTVTDSGAYRLAPSTVSSAALSINVGEWFQNGSQLIQKNYTNDTTYDDEWFIRPKILPMSGYEIEYDPGIWNNHSDIKSGTNCYAYALNNQYLPNTNVPWWMNPGITEEGFNCEAGNISADLVLEGVGYDSENLGFTFMSIGKYDVCPTGTYKVALVVDEGYDYHWYRQNADGTWSHKPGNTDVINFDASGNLIYDPETANRNYSYRNYDIFVGFFAVSPLNYIYVMPPVANGLEEENETESIQICMHSLAFMFCADCSAGVRS